MIRSFANGNLAKEKHAIQYIADNLSEQNKAEARLLYEDVPFSTLIKEQAEVTEDGFIFYDNNGNAHGIGGIMKNHCIWFVLTGDNTQAQYVSWLKNGRKWFEQMLDKWGTIHGWCWEKNELSMHWMRWFGFDFAPKDSEATSNISNEVFLYFQKTR